MGGLQDCIKSSGYGFDPEVTEFVQVININSCYWVAISTVGVSAGCIQWLDCMHSSPSDESKKVIAGMMQYHKSELVIQIMNVQRQRGSSDCGVFALALITAICFGLDPVSMFFDQKEMRKHLLKSIVTQEITPFPTLRKQEKRCMIVQSEIVPVYCICRLPSNKSEMIQCSSCTMCYHMECIKLPDTVRSQKWLCFQCETLAS